MTDDNLYDQTSGALAREAGTSVPTVQKYAEMGLLEFIRISNGTRLFRRGQADKVREICNRRTPGRRGRTG
jgi:DNA-binding transcriptional MerR regulator